MYFKSLISLAFCFGLPFTYAMAQITPALLKDMTGTWNVEQKMWPGSGAAAVQLPPAVAERRLIDGKYLEESMRPSTLTPGQPGYFVRNAIFNYNVASTTYEYFSIDTRSPQAMTEKSLATPVSNESKSLKLSGGTFVAPEWGPAKNVRFKYRLTVDAVQEGKQTVEMYLTPQSVLPKKEFLAFEYKYVRQP